MTNQDSEVKVKLKRNQVCWKMVSYLRQACQELFYGEKKNLIPLTRPTDLAYE
jgi:hypothetical protein